jgi:hypothetical protein
MKDEFNMDMKSLHKKNQTETLEFLKSNKRNTVESHSSRLEQVEDRILGLKDNIDIKEKEKNS